MSWVTAGFGLLVLSVATGCAIDDRTLHLDDGLSSGNGPNSGEAGASSGSGGFVDPPDVVLPMCAYSAGPLEAGCETMVENAGFGEDIEGWAAEPLAITVGWEESDATGSAGSGSIAVTNWMHGKTDGVAPGGGWQCLPTRAGVVYDMAADVFIPEGQGQGYTPQGEEEQTYVGRAGLSILFWPNGDCSSTSQSLNPSFQTNLIEETEEWQRVSGDAVAPDGAMSMSMRVLTVKPFKGFNFKALFDNVLLRERPSDR